MGFSTVEEAFAYIEGFTNFERITPQIVRDFKSSRMEELLELMGNPHEAFTSIHIAGSKGKGLTAAFLASVLTTAGIPTGLYTSPHVVTYRERISRGGEFFPDSVYIEAIDKLEAAVESRNSPFLKGEYEPTTFELLTVLAFTIFKETGLTWAVVETGIGGRLDATNIINPAFCVLTPVELEHTDILGDTIEKIASEKAGIIKPGVPAFSAVQSPPVERIFRETARSKGAPLTFLDEETESFDLAGGMKHLSLRWKDGGTLEAELAMFGRHQAENAALAALALRRLLPGTEPSFAAGLSAAHAPGRMEIREGIIPFVFDGAHTPASVKVLVRGLEELYPGIEKTGILIFGSVKGKDAEGMARILGPRFREIIISTPGTFKPSDPDLVRAAFDPCNTRVRLIADPAEALEYARSRAEATGGPVCVTGSFYMVAEILKRVD